MPKTIFVIDISPNAKDNAAYAEYFHKKIIVAKDNSPEEKINTVSKKEGKIIRIIRFFKCQGGSLWDILFLDKLNEK